jgi:hypothetical protein
MTLFFLALSVAFFFVQDFRWGLCSQSLFFLEGGEGSPARRFAQLCLASEEDFSALGQTAEQSGDAALLAFAALHPGSAGDAARARWADRAVAKDPQYTWLYYHLASGKMFDAGEPAVAAQLAPWVDKGLAADPDNAAVWLQRAELLRAQTKDWPKRTGPVLTPDSPLFQGLAAQTEWLAAMERAYAAPRYDTYVQKRFELERAVLRQHGLASPSVMLFFVSSYPIPNLLNVREYADFRVKQLGAKAEQARRLDDALAHYRTVVAFGKRMRVSGLSLIEELIGMAVELIGSEPLLPALQKAGRAHEAALVELERADLQRARTRIRGEDPIALTSNYYWSALSVLMSGMAVVLFGALTLLCVLYVNLKQWIRRQKRGRIYQLMTVAENYLPVLLFLSCAALYLTFRPYATNFHYYMTATGQITGLEPFFTNVFPNPIVLPRGYYLPVEEPFGAYLWWALGFGLAAVIIGGVQEWRARSS